ncbi:hypothetical protein G7Y79_00024g056520 [Physcia stellaris]|nr:hypothetical protein G7Y79_00024g056520 [Physcia stellaris]
MHSIGIPFLLLCSIATAYPATKPSPLPSLHAVCDSPTSIGTNASDFPFLVVGNGLDIFFCNRGEPIPPGEAVATLSSIIADIAPTVKEHASDPVPGGAFQKGQLFRPTGDRVTVFVHETGHDVTSWLSWRELSQILTRVENYMVGEGSPRQQHFHEMEFHVRSRGREIAIGRVQIVPGRALADESS